jgi:hypothetical protein
MKKPGECSWSRSLSPWGQEHLAPLLLGHSKLTPDTTANLHAPGTIVEASADRARLTELAVVVLDFAVLAVSMLASAPRCRSNSVVAHFRPKWMILLGCGGVSPSGQYVAHTSSN